jgi:hypothetical protein
MSDLMKRWKNCKNKNNGIRIRVYFWCWKKIPVWEMFESISDDASWCSTQVSSMLRGVQLTSVQCYGCSTHVSSMLRGVQLTSVQCYGCSTHVSSMLRGVQLTSVQCYGCSTHVRSMLWLFNSRKFNATWCSTHVSSMLRGVQLT